MYFGSFYLRSIEKTNPLIFLIKTLMHTREKYQIKRLKLKMMKVKWRIKKGKAKNNFAYNNHNLMEQIPV